MAIYKNSYPFGSIVRSGLVLNLDATNLASYPGTGTTWFDTSGNGNNGTLTNGPTYLQERGRSSVVFDGVDDNVQRNAISLGNNFTVGVWARPNAATRKTLVSNSYSYSSGVVTEGFLFNIGNNGTDLFLALGTDQYVRVSQTGLVSANTWFYGCASYDGTSIKLYFNGIETTYSINIGSPFAVTYNTRPLYVGYWVQASGLPYSIDTYAGRIGAVQIYNRALTAAEVQQNFNALRNRFGI